MMMMPKPNSVEELAGGIERYMLNTESLSEPDFDMLNLAAISLRKAAACAPEFMKKVLADAITLSCQVEVVAKVIEKRATAC